MRLLQTHPDHLTSQTLNIAHTDAGAGLSETSRVLELVQGVSKLMIELSQLISQPFYIKSA